MTTSRLSSFAARARSRRARPRSTLARPRPGAEKNRTVFRTPLRRPEPDPNASPAEPAFGSARSNGAGAQRQEDRRQGAHVTVREGGSERASRSEERRLGTRDTKCRSPLVRKTSSHSKSDGVFGFLTRIIGSRANSTTSDQSERFPMTRVFKYPKGKVTKRERDATGILKGSAGSFRGKGFFGIPNGNKPRRCPEPVRRRHAATVEKDAISRANQTPRASSRRRHTASRVATSRCPPTSAISPRRRKVRARRGHPERGAPCARAVRTRRIHDEARFPRAFSPSSPRPFRRPR